MNGQADHPSNGDINSSLARYLADAAGRRLRAEAEAEDRVMGETIRKYERAIGRHLFMRLTESDQLNPTPPPPVLIDATGAEWDFAVQLTPTSALYARPVRWWSLNDRRKWRRETRIALQL